MPKNLENYDLIIFDMDGTLADRDTSELLPGVRNWFRNVRPLLNAKVVIASNQGGVGLRYWMESEGFGEPEKYPTAVEVTAHHNRVVEAIFSIAGSDAIHDSILAFAYQSKRSGEWGPIPPDGNESDAEWQRKWFWPYGSWIKTYRKPLPGMLLDFMIRYKVPSTRTLMVGDSEDDWRAAIAAGCKFIDAAVFFNREPPRPKPRKRPPADSTKVYQGWGSKE